MSHSPKEISDAPQEPSIFHMRSIRLRNLRGFKKLDWTPLRPLTFLVGQNSSGKSSLADAIMLLAQSNCVPPLRAQASIDWSGSLVDLGSFEDTVYQHNKKLRIEVGVQYAPFAWRAGPQRGAPSDAPMSLNVKIGSNKQYPLGRVITLSMMDNLSSELLKACYNGKLRLQGLGGEFTVAPKARTERPWADHETIANTLLEHVEKIQPPAGLGAAWKRLVRFATDYEAALPFYETQRVSSGRSAPQRWYSLAEMVKRQVSGFGPNTFDAVDPAMISLAGQDAHFFPWRHQQQRSHETRTLDHYLRHMEIGDSIGEEGLSTYHSKIGLEDTITGVRANLVDVGYGASQIIPVISACLSNAQGLLFVEQPEIHLHPKAQSVIADLLAETSKQRQVIVETHSVHLINRARIKILDGELNHRDVIILFVQRTRSGTEVVPILLDRKAEFDRPWPSGFFDERHQDTMRLLTLKAAHGD